MVNKSEHSLDFLKSRPEDDSFHRSRIMFCLIDGRLEVGPKNTPESHIEWFRREGWLTDGNAEEFLKKNIRGFYLPKENKLYCYRSVGFDFDDRVLPELLNKIEDFKNALGLNDETEIRLGPKDSPIYGEEYLRMSIGKLKEIKKEQIMVVAAIIQRGDRYLITQRPEDVHLPLKWELPGGKVEFGEDPKNALMREIAEELGIKIHVFGRPLDCSSFVYDNGRHVILLAFSCYFDGPRLIKKVGIKDYKWVTLKQIARYDFCEADIPLVKKLRRKEI